MVCAALSVIAVSAAVHPEYRKVLGTYLASTGDEVVTVPYGEDGRTDLAALKRQLDGNVAAVVFQMPLVEPPPLKPHGWRRRA